MKKRWLICVGLVLPLLVAAVWLDPTYTLQGVLKRESFYRGRPTTYWRKALIDSPPKAYLETVRELKEGGPSAVPVLVQLLQNAESSDWEGAKVRWLAAEILGEIGADARDACPALVQALKDRDAHVRVVSATALGNIGPAKEAVSGLIEMLQTGQTEDKLSAARSLAYFGADARPAVGPLQRLLKDKNAQVRWNAANALGKIGPDAKEAIPALVAALKDEDEDVREHAAEALGEMGPSAGEAVPPLIEVLRDPAPRVRRDAVRSLGQIGPAARVAAPELRKRLQDENPKVREAATKSLRQIETANERP